MWAGFTEAATPELRHGDDVKEGPGVQGREGWVFGER